MINEELERLNRLYLVAFNLGLVWRDTDADGIKRKQSYKEEADRILREWPSSR